MDSPCGCTVICHKLRPSGRCTMYTATAQLQARSHSHHHAGQRVSAPAHHSASAGRGVFHSCNTRRMAETAAHLTDHVFPRLPVRQWVLSVPKRLRYYMQREGPVLGMVLRIFLRVIAQTLQANSPGAANVDKAALHI